MKIIMIIFPLAIIPHGVIEAIFTGEKVVVEVGVGSLFPQNLPALNYSQKTCIASHLFSVISLAFSLSKQRYLSRLYCFLLIGKTMKQY